MDDWFEKLYQTQSDYLYGIAVHEAKGNPRVIQEIPDILQRVFTLLYQKRHILVDHPHIEAWLVITTRKHVQKAMDSICKDDRHQSFSFDDPTAEDQFVRAEAALASARDDKAEQLDEMMAAIEEAVGPEGCQLLKAYHEPHMRAGDLARSLGITEPALRKRVSRLRKAIRQTANFFCILIVFVSQIRR